MRNYFFSPLQEPNDEDIEVRHLLVVSSVVLIMGIF